LGDPPRVTLPRLLALGVPWVLGACGTLLGLSDLEKVDCVANCSGANSGGVTTTGGNASVAGSLPTSGTGSSVYNPGGSTGTLPTGGVSGNVGGSLPSAGSAPIQGGAPDNGGAGGEAPLPTGDVCPGGPEPALTWQEHWFEHVQLLKRVYYDDCIVLYFDDDMSPATKDWMAPFLTKAWAYSLTNYGKIGSERLYAVAHLGKYGGGHSSTYIEASHDNHSVIDMGLDSWVDGDYDMPAHLLSYLVDDEGAYTKIGAPKFEHYGNEGFPLIYKYDLYLGLGLTAAAEQSLSDFDTQFNSRPYANTFWFRDWFYPIWRDHEHAQVFANYMTLLQKYYPVANDGWMPTMNYGQYFHFMSGAAGVDLVPLSKTAFTWYPGLEDEVTAAKQDFPDIKY
jgi:hypothetical protein